MNTNFLQPTKGETDAKLSLVVICYPENLIVGRRQALKGAGHQPLLNNSNDTPLAESGADVDAHAPRQLCGVDFARMERLAAGHLLAGGYCAHPGHSLCRFVCVDGPQMTFSFRIKSPERDAFTGSAICVGGIVRVRTSGCLTFDCDNSQNKAHSSAHSEPVPLLPLPPARQLVARLRQQVLRLLLSRPFSSVVVIGNTLRRLASVLLLRQSQPPHGLALAQAIVNWCGLPITRRSVFSRAQACKQSARGISQTLCVGVSSTVVALGFHEQQSTTGKIPNDGKSTAQSRNSTARDGNNAC